MRLTDGVAESLPSLATGQSVIYAIDAPDGKARLEFTTYGGRGTLGMYANYEVEPMAAGNLEASLPPGTNQAVNIASPASGRYYLRVKVNADTAGVLVRARMY